MSAQHTPARYSPENPPPLRREGETVEDYRVRCGWDAPKASAQHPANTLEELAGLAQQMPWEAAPADVPHGAKLAFRNAMTPELFMEMLAALKELVRVHIGPKLNDEGPSYRAVTAARAVIAKAGGTTA
jgi:hypothetical protein